MSMPPPPGEPFPQQPPGWGAGSPMPPQPPGFQAYPGGSQLPAKQGNSGMAVASLVCSLVGVIPCFWLFQITGLLGVIFGFVGLKQTKDGARGGRGMALAGVIIGLVLVVLCVIFWIYFATHANCVRVGRSYQCTAD